MRSGPLPRCPTPSPRAYRPQKPPVLHEPQKVTGRQARWIEFLQDFDYTLEHIAGTTNTVADLLSRQKDLNKGVDSELPRTLLPNHLFSSPSPPPPPSSLHHPFSAAA